MERIIKPVRQISQFLNIIAGCALTFMMLITVLDVVLRSFRIPIVGTYELVAFAGGVVIGFSVPLSSLLKIHVYVDVLIAKFPFRTRMIFHLVTRLMGIFLFSMVGWNLMKMGVDLMNTGEVSLTLQLPFYPIAFGIGISFFIQCLVLVVQMVQVIGGTYE